MLLLVTYGLLQLKKIANNLHRVDYSMPEKEVYAIFGTLYVRSIIRQIAFCIRFLSLFQLFSNNLWLEVVSFAFHFPLRASPSTKATATDSKVPLVTNFLKSRTKLDFFFFFFLLLLLRTYSPWCWVTRGSTSNSWIREDSTAQGIIHMILHKHIPNCPQITFSSCLYH